MPRGRKKTESTKRNQNLTTLANDNRIPLMLYTAPIADPMQAMSDFDEAIAEVKDYTVSDYVAEYKLVALHRVEMKPTVADTIRE